MQRTRCFIATVCAALAAPSGVLGQGLRDPMQPPGMAQARAGASRPASTGLQAIVTSPQRKLALIDGRLLELGDATRQGELVGVTDSSAVLRRGGRRDVVLMHPEVEKKPSRSREREPGTR